MRDRTSQQHPQVHDRAGAERPAAVPPLPALLRVADGATLARAAIAMQRTHGNAAVASVLAREPVAYARPPRPQDGLADSGAVSRLAEAGERLGRDWLGLATPEARAGVLLDAANAELRALGIPEVGIGPVDRKVDALFDYKSWTMKVDFSALEAASATDVLKPLVETFAHETRHSDQWFRVARLLAGRRMDARSIALDMLIPDGVARAAHRRPLDPESPEAAEADAWYESVYGAGQAERKRVLDRIPEAAEAMHEATREYEEARQALRAIRADPGADPAEKAAAERRVQDLLRKAKAAVAAYAALKSAYDALPEELDADEFGDAVAGEMT